MAVAIFEPLYTPDKRAFKSAVKTGRGLQVRYDRRLDMIAVTLGEPCSCYSVAVEEGVIERVDMRTNEVVGYEFYDFRLLFLSTHPELEHPYALVTNPLYALLAMVRPEHARRRRELQVLAPMLKHATQVA